MARHSSAMYKLAAVTLSSWMFAIAGNAATILLSSIRTPAQGRRVQRVCFALSRSLMRLEAMGPDGAYLAGGVIIHGLSMMWRRDITSVVLFLTFLATTSSARGSVKKTRGGGPRWLRLAVAGLHVASCVMAVMDLARRVPGFCPQGTSVSGGGGSGSGGGSGDGGDGGACPAFYTPHGETFSEDTQQNITSSWSWGGVLHTKNDADAARGRRRRKLATLANVSLVSCYDGDTCHFALPRVVERVPELAPLFGERVAVRVYGVDCPELGRGARCERERLLGARAREATLEMLRRGSSVRIEDARPDKYFRVLGRIIVDPGGVDVGEELVRRKLGVSYHGGARSGAPWCS